jgi:two-component system chemotaxis sensor kinase CheA
MSSPLQPEESFLRPEELAEIRQTFFDQGRDAVESLGRTVLALEGLAPTSDRLKSLRRAAHTLKSDCASVGFPALSSLSHALEDALVGLETGAQPVSADQVDVLLQAVDALRDGLESGVRGEFEPDVTVTIERLRTLMGDAPGGDAQAAAPGEAAADKGGREGETVRIEAARIDETLTLVGELVTVRSTLAGLAGEIERHLPEDLSGRLADVQSVLGRALQELQRTTMRMRMVPVDRVFRRFTRVVRDLGRQTGKRLRLHIEGETTELDRGILESLEEPLLHLVRNAVSHGIEDPEERAAKGKPEEARLTLRAGREGNQILIEVSDDGRGIDVDAVRRRAVERGFVRQEDADALPDADALQLVFSPGLSTAQVVTEHSGRGVGLDVVRETVESLRGSVTAHNARESGAVFLIRVPLTIAIIQALLFRVNGLQLAVPLSSVVEIAQVGDVTLQRVGSFEIVKLRDQVLGLVRLRQLLGFPDAPPRGYVMILQCAGAQFGVLADEMCGEQELVIKRVHDRWIRTSLVAGASIVGGGLPTLILDVLSVYRAALTQGAVAHD